MVHHRFNEKESNPNPHVNFITALPAEDATEQESARQLLRALAAQVRPIMKSHGFAVNSLEEYEHNNVFAGRNWNAGETIELVLRRPDRTFLPMSWLMGTLCHELAHIKHMHHGPAFHALWRRLNAEVRALQAKGYYGDGYWSSGTRLVDNERVAGEGIEPGDLPEYMCGGAQTRRRPTVTRTRRRPRKPRDTTIVASTSTGRQTAKRRKAGARVTSKAAFVGEGKTLADDAVESKGKGKGTGFGKQAASQRAREERALAAERRILALQGQAGALSSSTSISNVDSETDSDVEEVEEAMPESDADRRKALLASEQNEGLDELKSGNLWGYFEKDFDFRESKGQSSTEPGLGCDLPSGSGAVGISGASASKGKRRKYESDDDDDGVVILPPAKVSRTSDAASSRKGKAAPTEPPASTSLLPETRNASSRPVEPQEPRTSAGWACLVCTLCNELEHLACSACATPRGETAWTNR
ncbi:putative WLM domain containing protein [Lyophyllum shimeji]|uniref:WLM domain containing protein n=1 Tax=Lyophyllum shimeji TaxID=47721 RepID=A0A9P3PRX6_LYOSH|nr:putative WLM domain containing protein [Lyophyllum shimeji]